MPVRRTGADEHPLRIGDDRANAPEVVAQGNAKLAQTSTRPVQQPRIGHLVQHVAIADCHCRRGNSDTSGRPVRRS